MNHTPGESPTPTPHNQHCPVCRVSTEKIIYLSFFVDKLGRMRDNTVMKLSDKKKNEIRVIAKYLREQLTDFASFQYAMKELFKGEAGIELDNDHQVVVYTGHQADIQDYGLDARLMSASCMDSLENNYLETRKD